MIATLLWPFSFVTVMWFSPDVPKPRDPPPQIDTTAADAAAAEENKKIGKKKGKAATILTSPAGAKLGESGQGGQKTLGTA